MWDTLGQWDTHHEVIEGQHDWRSDGGVGNGQTWGQCGTDWDNGTLTVM